MTFKEMVRQHIDNDDRFSKLEKYVFLIEEKNKVMNLTGFTGDKLWEEGIYESIICLEKSFNDLIGKNLLDIGAGAGFPSVPFLIAHPEIKLTIFEPQVKRTKFLEEVNDELNLNIEIVVTRAEDTTYVDYFDFITARAVAPFYAMAEISFKPAKLNAKFAWVKGPSIFEELDQAKKIINKLHIDINVNRVEIISTKEVYMVEYYKIINTPVGIPRAWAQIVKK